MVLKKRVKPPGSPGIAKPPSILAINLSKLLRSYYAQLITLSIGLKTVGQKESVTTPLFDTFAMQTS
jgi:hypothetical protein